MCCGRLLLLYDELVMCVFFFKQKTAYEMRISDWSSDVCSSDLILAPPRPPPTETTMTHRRILRRVLILLALLVTLPLLASGVSVATQEIGRASCRERVCQYV